MTDFEEQVKLRAIELMHKIEEFQYEGLYWSDLYPAQREALLIQARKELQQELENDIIDGMD